MVWKLNYHVLRAEKPKIMKNEPNMYKILKLTNLSQHSTHLVRPSVIPYPLLGFCFCFPFQNSASALTFRKRI